MQNNIIDRISKIVAKLPGLGPRIAKKIILHLLSDKEKFLKPLILALQEIEEKAQKCKICGNIDEGEICNICASKSRDSSIICIVEEVADLFAIEKAEIFRGKYHILNGRLSALLGNNFESLNLNSLYKRLENSALQADESEKIKEIIIATSATVDGQTTAHFLTESLKEFDVKITRLAYGIPVGGELDYLDEGTLNIAFKTRSDFE